jgi:hypothetical protein
MAGTKIEFAIENVIPDGISWLVDVRLPGIGLIRNMAISRADGSGCANQEEVLERTGEIVAANYGRWLQAVRGAN